MTTRCQLRTAIWTFLGVCAAVSAVASAASGLRIDPVSFCLVVFPLATSLLAAEIVSRRPGLAWSAPYADVAFAGVAMSLIALVSSYAAMKVGMPLADDRLVALDAAMGMEWEAIIRFVDRSWLASKALEISYSSFAVQLLLIPLLLVFVGRTSSAYAFVISFGLLCMIASGISTWYPALGAHVMFNVDPTSLVNINPHYGYFFLDEFNAVRDETGFMLAFDRAAGIVTFPSCHAGAAVICAIAGCRIRFLRFLLVPLNAGMAFSAITHGSHYVIDVIAGVTVALLSVAAAELLAWRFRESRAAEQATGVAA